MAPEAPPLQKVTGCWRMLSHLSTKVCSLGIVHNSSLNFQSHIKCISKFKFFHLKKISELQLQQNPLKTYQQNRCQHVFNAAHKSSGAQKSWEKITLTLINVHFFQWRSVIQKSSCPPTRASLLLVLGTFFDILSPYVNLTPLTPLRLACLSFLTPFTEGPDLLQCSNYRHLYLPLLWTSLKIYNVVYCFLGKWNNRTAVKYIYTALISSSLYSNTLLTEYLSNHDMTLLYLANFTRKCSALGLRPEKKMDSLNVVSCPVQAVKSLHMGIQCRPSLFNTFFLHCCLFSSLTLVPWPELVVKPSVCFSLHPEPTCPESLHSGVWSYRYPPYCISMSLLSIAWGVGYREGKSSAQVNLHRDTMLHAFAQKYTQIETHTLLFNAWFTHIATMQAYDRNTQIAFVCFRYHTQLPCELFAQVLSVRKPLSVVQG